MNYTSILKTVGSANVYRINDTMTIFTLTVNLLQPPSFIRTRDRLCKGHTGEFELKTNKLPLELRSSGSINHKISQV